MTHPPDPPRWAAWLLHRCVAPSRRADVTDDLAELFRLRTASDGLPAARWRYVLDVLSIIRRRALRRDRPVPPAFSYDQARGPLMWQNYLKTALRTLRRHPGTTAINVTGLAVGIACCVLIALFVRDELSFDRFHTHADRLHRAWVDENYGENERFINTVTPLPLGPALEAGFPEVEDAVRVARIASMVKQGEETFPESVHLVDSTFFDVFSFPLVRGEAATALDQPNSVILTETLAQKYFGTADPIGRTLTLEVGDGFQDFTVTGLAADVPTYSSIQFGLLISFHHSRDVFSERMHRAWFNVITETYVLLREDASPDALTAKLDALSRQILGDEYEPGVYTIGLQPMPEIHLDPSLPAGLEPTSDPAYSTILSAIALLVLLIACINFTTLAIGRSAGRALEVGVRKVVGAQRPQLMGQFWGEAVLMTLVALGLGLGLAWAALPVFNTLAGRSLTLALDGQMLAVLGGLVLVVGLLAGSYPAVVLSAFRPIEVLKGKLKLNRRTWFQRGLTVVQFALSIFLIIATLGMREQLQYLQTTNLGFETEQTVVIPTNAGIQEGQEIAARFQEALADEPTIAGVAWSAFALGDGWATVGYTDDQGAYRQFITNIVSPEFDETVGLEFVAGRSLSRDTPADLARGLLVNEAFVAAYGWENPIGQRLPGPNFPDHEVIGVVKDFHFASLHTPIQPMAMAATPEVIFRGIENQGFASSPSPDLTVRIQAGDLPAALTLLEETWAAVAPGQEFNFTFLDERLDRQYRQEQQLSQIVTAAAGLAILIACLGLFGLAALTAVQRTKEIGIRKVLGATVPHLSLLLTRDFALLVGLAFVAAAPVAYLVLHRWLDDFAYRADLSPWLFLAAGALALVVAVLTVSYQAIKTALTNPVRVLRYE